MDEYELQIGIDTIWVHSPNGYTVGRFSQRFGVDIHREGIDNLNQSECLHCTHKKPSKEDWDFFRGYANEKWNLPIPGDLFIRRKDQD